MMRRSEKAVTDLAGLEAILRAGRVCQLAIADQPAPYLVSLNYGYDDRCLYFHSAADGRKISLLQEHPVVSFTVAIDGGVVSAERACNWTNRFQSIVGHGIVTFMTEANDKRRALDLIMAQYGGIQGDYPAAALTATCVYKLEIQAMTGKRSRMDV